MVAQPKNILIIGLGLLGGSIALDLKNLGADKLIGIDHNQAHCKKALSMGIVDSIADDLSQTVPNVDCVVIAIPVNHIATTLTKVLDRLGSDAWVFDVGSVKKDICKTVSKHPLRGHFVAMHPIAGTENSGPTAALKGLFNGKTNIICDREKTNERVLDLGVKLSKKLGMRNVFMNSADHDKHIAYVSHLSHISSFMLGKTVLGIEKEEKNIFNMAGSGFESTVRLAKSSPEMWGPIFIENKETILKSLEEYIKNLLDFKTMVQEENIDKLKQTMQRINRIKKILEGIVT